MIFIYFLWIIFYISCIQLFAIDNLHFYRAPFFWGEPRLERDWLSTGEVHLGYGATKHGYNRNGKKTKLLNILGPHAMQHLGENVPNLSSTDPLDQILIDLQNLPKRKDFGDLIFNGKFRIVEMPINLYQNLINGFFMQAHIPLRHLQLNRITFKDISPDDAVVPNRNTPEWQLFLKNFDAILHKYKISLAPTNRTGFGDLTILAGWTMNYENTTTLDYVDMTGKVGALMPTGKKRNEHRPFELPLGYNGYFACPLQFDFSVGALEWLTFGLHLSGLFFFKRTKELPIKTARDQNGFIKLATTQAAVEPGNLYSRTVYFKADHLMHGISFLVNYCYDSQDNSCIKIDQSKEATIIANSDKQYKRWSMQTIQILVEYDMSKHNKKYCPRIGVFYNRIIGGKRIFNTSIVGGYAGLEICWQF